MKDCIYQNQSNSSLSRLIDRQANTVSWHSSCAEQQQQQLQHNGPLNGELNESNHQDPHQVIGNSASKNNSMDSMAEGQTSTAMHSAIQNNTNNNDNNNTNNNNQTSASSLTQSLQQYSVANNTSSIMQHPYQHTPGNNYLYTASYSAGGIDATNDSSGNQVPDHHQQQQQHYDSGTGASPGAQQAPTTGDHGQELSLGQQQQAIAEHITNSSAGSGVMGRGWSSHSGFVQPAQVSQNSSLTAYMAAYPQPHSHHLHEHLNQHQEHAQHQRADQYGSLYHHHHHHHHSHNQSAGNHGQLMLHRPADHVQGRHSVAATLGGYPGSDSTAATYNSSSAAAAFYSSSLYAANAKAAMLHQHQTTGYGHNEQHLQQQTIGLPTHETTNQIDRNHHHTTPNHLTNTNQVAPGADSAQDQQTDHQNPLWQNPLLTGTFRMSATSSHYQQQQQQHNNQHLLHQQQQSSLEQNAAGLAVPSSSNGEAQPELKKERVSDTELSSLHEQQQYSNTCSQSGSSSLSRSTSASSASSHSFSSTNEAAPIDAENSTATNISNSPGVIQRLPQGNRRARNGRPAANKRRANSFKQPQQMHIQLDQGVQSMDDIHNPAPYKDKDIEHTSDYIIVTNPKNGDRVRLTNGELTLYTTRQLNKVVARFPKETVAKLKQRRRTLKNRGYAQNCRHKRLDQKNKLEKENDELRKENEKQKILIADLREQVRLYSHGSVVRNSKIATPAGDRFFGGNNL